VESEAQAKRIENKMPCYYAREYQIPDSPKILQINPSNLFESEKPFEIPILLESRSSLIKVKKDSFTSLDDIFEDKKVISVNLNSARLKGILKKSKLNNINQNELAFTEKSELETIKSVIQVAGVPVNETDEYITLVNFHLHKLTDFQPEMVRENLLAIRGMIETYHKFRIQLVHGKSRSFLPVSYKQNQVVPPAVGSAPSLLNPSFISHQPVPSLPTGYHNHSQANKTREDVRERGYNYQGQEQHTNNPYQQFSMPNQPNSTPHQNYPNIYSAPPNQQRYPLQSNQPVASDIYQNRQFQGRNNDNDFNQRRQNNSKRKTVPCRLYHSPVGCERGDNCDFIHDANYKGLPTPNMEKYVRPIDRLSKNQEVNSKNQMRFDQLIPKGDHSYEHSQGFGYENQRHSRPEYPGYREPHYHQHGDSNNQSRNGHYQPHQEPQYANFYSQTGGQASHLDKRYYNPPGDREGEKRNKYN
jgi:hypothetical protein